VEKREKPLDKRVEIVETATSTDDKGRSLEELTSRFLVRIPGFAATGSGPGPGPGHRPRRRQAAT
jgi:hypothetical protein